MFDYVIANALVLDGTGIPGCKRDVAIKGEKIAAVSQKSLVGEAERTIDADGLALSPGFVDMHTHADLSIFTDPYAKNLALQGVTLAVVGNCGQSPAPLSEEVKKMWEQRLPWGEDTKRGDVLSWSGFREYVAAINTSKTSVNTAVLIGHNAIRSYAIRHYTKKREPSHEEMKEMKLIVEEAMDSGTVGMSSGLMYSPGFYSTTQELIELCRVVAEWGGIYFTHMRGEANELLQSVTEAIKIAETAKVSTQISHHRAECRVNWRLIRHSLQMMADANKHGANVTCDFFPYLACGVGGGIPLPRWASPLYMKREEAVKIINDPELRKKIKEQLKLGTQLGPEARSYEPVESLEDVVITVYPGHPELQGKTVVELAKIKGVDDPYDFFLDTVVNERIFGVVSFNIWEEDLEMLVKSPLAMVGTDSAFVDDVDRPNRHPRAYGSYAVILGKYVRDKKLITLEEAVMKLSTRPHAKLGILDRGLIRLGFFADLVLFEPRNVIDKADYSGKGAYPEGIRYVFVNGQPIVANGQHTGSRPGRLLKHTSDS